MAFICFRCDGAQAEAPSLQQRTGTLELLHPVAVLGNILACCPRAFGRPLDGADVSLVEGPQRAAAHLDLKRAPAKVRAWPTVSSKYGRTVRAFSRLPFTMGTK